MNARADDFRQWHYLRRNHSTRVPGRILCFDTETLPEEIPGKRNERLETLRLWRGKSCRFGKRGPFNVREHAGTTREQFVSLLAELSSPRHPLWIFAHNLGFDITVLRLWELIESGTLTFSNPEITVTGEYVDRVIKRWRGMAVIDDPPVILKMRIAGTDKTLTFVDSYNYFRCPLAKLGQNMNLDKLPMPEREEDQFHWDEYCKRDTEILYRAVTGLMGFVIENDLGTWSYTAPGQAMAAYKHRFMETQILIHGNTDVTALEREAYMGGRNQCFYVGKIVQEPFLTSDYDWMKAYRGETVKVGPVVVCDIQSCYPAVMRDNLFPVKLLDYCVSPICGELCKALESDNLVIARVRLDTSSPFPVRRNGRTFYARGRYVTSLCGPELRRALMLGAIKWVGAMATYKGEQIFRHYVNYFYHLRNHYKLENNGVYADLCKIFLNSLFGKFGQRSYSWVDCPAKTAPQPWGLWPEINGITKVHTNYRSLAWLVQRESKIGEAFNSAPAIAAYVTSYARELVQWYLELAGEHNCYYIDTDSLHVNMEGYDKLSESMAIAPYQIGKLKVVASYDTAEYRGLKDYTVGDMDVIAGIKHSARRLHDGSREQLQFQRLRSILANTPPPGVTVKTVRVSPGKHVPPGVLQCDGTLLAPILDE